jgi:ribonuclease HII
VRGAIEEEFTAQGLTIAGVDEVGRGCLAGPVYAACTILDYGKLLRLPPETLKLIRDSKTLSSDQRQRIVPVIQEVALEWSIGKATVGEIERYGILRATFLAMRRALKSCRHDVCVLLIDGKLPLAGYKGRQQAIVKGDNLCYAIAAASILAKEARDAFMQKQAEAFPAYGFEHHVGYATRHHLAMLKEHGITPLHRRNFAPVTEYAEIDASQSSLFI